MNSPELARHGLLIACMAWALPHAVANAAATEVANGAATGVEGKAPTVAPLDAAARRTMQGLDCAKVTGADVAELLASRPAPRIILFQGSLSSVTMDPFGEFLIAMGYPALQIRDPRDGRLSQSSFDDSLQWAGALAWYYESEGMMPMLIGHSQGGMLAIRILYELDGAFHDAIPVWNPITGAALGRTTIRDPRTGATQPVKGLKVGYSAALATGKLMRIFLGQWDMIPKLRRIPDTAVSFTGFAIPWDPIAGTAGDPEPYVAIGTARVRNVILPVSTSHLRIPEARDLAANAATRAWIEAYVPEIAAAPVQVADVDTTNLLHAADIWFSVKKNWCESAQQALRTQVTH
ncbi:MAG: hypothetical protein ABI607_02360 [Betaproteobacteria bacterium]